MDEGINIVRDSILPVSQQQAGFQGLLFLTDSDTNKGIAITLWESEEDMLAGESGGYYREAVAKAAALFATPPTMEHFEVSVQD